MKNPASTDRQLILRDELVAEMIRMAAENTDDPELFDRINEAVRDSIDIEYLELHYGAVIKELGLDQIQE